MHIKVKRSPKENQNLIQIKLKDNQCSPVGDMQCSGLSIHEKGRTVLKRIRGEMLLMVHLMLILSARTWTLKAEIVL